MAKKAIICVDDEKIVLDSLKNELRPHFSDDYTLEFAESGEEAIEIMEEFYEDNIDVPLVISDYIMPQMKGDQVLTKSKELFPKSYNILLTGQATIEGVINAINNAQLYRYMPKPWESNDLIMTISEALKSYENEETIDKQYNEIKEKNEKILKVNAEITEINKNLDNLVKIRTQKLEEKIEELLEVRIGKKAFIILFIITIIMFLLVDAIIEPLLNNTLNNFFVVLGIKFVIAIAFKPVETQLEKFLLNRARQRAMNNTGNNKMYDVNTENDTELDTELDPLSKYSDEVSKVLNE